MDWKSFLRAVFIPFLLAGLATACSQSATAPSPTGPLIVPSLTLPTDTANSVRGVVSARTPDGIQPISGAIVELFVGGSRESGNMLDPLKGTLTGAKGGYVMYLPEPDGNSGATGPDGQPFEVRVRKEGYRSASQSFRAAYSVWDYVDIEINLELVRVVVKSEFSRAYVSVNGVHQ